MGVVRDAAKQLELALRTVPGATVYTDPGAGLEDLPALVVMPPALTYESTQPGATHARFLVFVVEQSDEQTVERLWERVAQVGEAVDTHSDAVVLRADPSAWPLTEGNSLPAYEITIESPLEVA